MSNRGQLRTRRIGFAVAALSVSGLCAAGLTPAAGNSPKNNIDKKIAAADDDLAGADKQVNSVAQRLAQIRPKLAAAQAKQAAAQRDVASASQAQAVAVKQLRLADAAVLVGHRRVSVAQAQVARLRAEIGLLARTVYTSGGGFEEVQVLLDSQDPTQFATALASLKRISQGNNHSLEQITKAEALLKTQLAQLQILQDRADQRREQAQVLVQARQRALEQVAAAKVAVAGLLAKEQAALRQAAGKRDAIKKMYNALLAEQRRIAAEAVAEARREAARKAKEEKRRKNGGESSGSNDSGSNDSGSNDSGSNEAPGATGRLSWPVPGDSVGGQTGWRVHPVYGYRSCHTGDDTHSSYGTPIHSAAAGTVLSTDSGGPYGNHTVVSHGNGLTTMYAHQSRIVVSPGEHVSRGQVIGYVGSTGWSTGAHLHFEVHINGTPWEPMGWFGESPKHRVDCWSG